MSQHQWRITKQKCVILSNALSFLIKAKKKHSELFSKSEFYASSVQKLIAAVEQVLASKRLKQIFECEPENESVQYVFQELQLQGNALIEPRMLGQTKAAINQYLMQYSLKYTIELGGIWCAFRKPRLVEHFGFTSTNDSLGLINIELTVKVLIFKPNKFAQLVGTVQNINPTGIDCLVLSIFPCVIPSSFLLDSQKINLSEENNYEILDKTNTQTKPIQKNTILKFLVNQIIYDTTNVSQTYYLEGSLKPVFVNS